MKKNMSFLLVILVLLSFVGCSSKPNVPSVEVKEAIEVVTETKQLEVEDVEAGSETIMITDMAGRSLEIPSQINSVFTTNPVGMVLVYTLAPEVLAGWNYEFNDDEKSFIQTEYRSLPVFGTIKTVNVESLIGVDVIISAASLDEKMQAKMNDFQDKIGIPIIMVDESLARTREVYTFLGDILETEARAKMLSDYADSVFDKVKNADVSKPKSIYYGNGVSSLDTSAKGTPPSEIFDIIGAINVCDLKTESPDRIEVTAEHLITWNPDYIFVNGEPMKDVSGNAAAVDIYNNESYKNLEAVRNETVVSIPKAPFAWIDRPRSSNRLIGIAWAGNILYPESFDFTSEDIKEFYSLFYGVKITDAQISDLLVK